MASDKLAEALALALYEDEQVRWYGGAEATAELLAAWLRTPEGRVVVARELGLVDGQMYEDERRLRLGVMEEKDYYVEQLGLADKREKRAQRETAVKIAEAIERLPICVACDVEGQPCDVKKRAVDVARSFTAPTEETPDERR